MKKIYNFYIKLVIEYLNNYYIDVFYINKIGLKNFYIWMYKSHERKILLINVENITSHHYITSQGPDITRYHITSHHKKKQISQQL